VRPLRPIETPVWVSLPMRGSNRLQSRGFLTSTAILAKPTGREHLNAGLRKVTPEASIFENLTNMESWIPKRGCRIERARPEPDL
jgi:hypothetical protein